MRWEEMTPSEAVENAEWIGPRLHPFKAYDVGMVFPTGFDAYARILHPAHGDGATPDVRWSEIARWSHRTIHPEVQFVPITEPLPGFGTDQQPWRYPPRDGTMATRQVEALIRLLSKHTRIPGACWFCLWEGQGYLPPASAGRVDLPNRRYLVFRGSIHDAVGWEDGPNLWWPDDRAWFVASEIDHSYSYVGGSKALIKELLAQPEIEAVPARLEDSVAYDGDRINTP